MKLTLDSLKEMGAFVDGSLVEKEVTWKQDGEEHTATVHVRRMSYTSVSKELKSEDALAGRISACICDEDGKPVFTPEDITGEASEDRGPLNGNLTLALINAIAEVNYQGKKTH